MCCTADCTDMNRARSAGKGMREDSVCRATECTALASMNTTKTTITGTRGRGGTKPTRRSSTSSAVPMAVTTTGPSRSTKRPPMRMATKLTSPPTR